jgi:carbamoyltransferase
MTITFDCTEEMKDKCPGVVHVDGTARPQVVRREVNPVYYDIIDEYEKLTGNPSIINTSFNVHDEPIVATPEDAVQGFLKANLDYLAIGNLVVTNPKGVENRGARESLRAQAG